MAAKKESKKSEFPLAKHDFVFDSFFGGQSSLPKIPHTVTDTGNTILLQLLQMRQKR